MKNISQASEWVAKQTLCVWPCDGMIWLTASVEFNYNMNPINLPLDSLLWT